MRQAITRMYRPWITSPEMMFVDTFGASDIDLLDEANASVAGSEHRLITFAVFKVMNLVPIVFTRFESHLARSDTPNIT